MQVFDETTKISSREFLWDWHDSMKYIVASNDNSNVVRIEW
jgi:hypothetical protein